MITLPKTVALIGIMGAGKSTVGRILADRLDVNFVDLDHAIEDRQGHTISEIFNYIGEDEFRGLEYKAVEYELEEEPHILATGGGAFINDKTRALLKENTITVWLKADLGVLVERVSRKNTRPILEQGNKAEIMEILVKKRYPIYAEADIIIDSDDGPHIEVAKKIVEALKEYNQEAA